MGLWSDKQILQLKKIVASVHEYNTNIGIQLNHAGRKSQVNGTTIAPSAISYPGLKMPQAMDQKEINRVINLFKSSTIRANKAGFDFIEIHAAHGYLISEFLSPLTNHRTDAYGGSIFNRAKFLKEVIQTVRAVWPKEKALIVRVSAEDYEEAGNHPDDLAAIINYVKEEGVDIIDVSSGGVTNVKVLSYPGYQLEMARIIKEKTKLFVIGGGLLTDAKMMEDSLKNSLVDFIFLGLELLRNPYFPLQVSQQLGVKIEWPKQYIRAQN